MVGRMLSRSREAKMLSSCASRVSVMAISPQGIGQAVAAAARISTVSIADGLPRA